MYSITIKKSAIYWRRIATPYVNIIKKVTCDIGLKIPAL